MSQKLKTAPVLAFERKLDPSDALLFAGSWSTRKSTLTWSPVKVREKAVRGTMSHRLKTEVNDPAKLDVSVRNPNPQTIDVATLPFEADTLKVQFTLRILGGVGEPSACSDADYRKKLLSMVDDYVHQQKGFHELARRYAANLANGRFLWRNRVGAEHVEVDVAHLQEGHAVARWTFQALDYSLLSLQAPDSEAQDLAALAALIESGLTGKAFVVLQVTAFARVGAGQEVFPSQELIMERGRGTKSKTLYKIGDAGKEIAAIHSQKIGNALRTIDTWYPGGEKIGPIPVEPYGSVTTRGEVYRLSKKFNFYSLLDHWVLNDQVPELDQQHFVMAVLVRGGVFGGITD